MHYLPSWVSDDPAFTHAHITALSPYLPRPTAADLARVAAVARATAPFDYVLREIQELPDGFIQVAARPGCALRRADPGVVGGVPAVPALREGSTTSPRTSPSTSGPTTVSVASTRALLGDLLPARCRADRLELHWYEEGNCHVLADWKLTGG